MKRIFYGFAVAALVAALIGQVQATPNQALWERMIFIGYGEDHYYFYRIRREQPGSYYEYTDYVWLCKRPFDRQKPEERLALREVRNFAPKAEPPWKQEDTLLDPPNPAEYLIEEKVRHAFPASEFGRGFEALVTSEGLMLRSDSEAACLLPYKDFADGLNTEVFKGFIEERGEVPVVARYESKEYQFFVIQYGPGTYDTDLYQDIVLVKQEKVRRAFRTLMEKDENTNDSD